MATHLSVIVQHFAALCNFAHLILRALHISECDIPVPGFPGPGNFAPFLMVPVPEKMVPEKSTGTGPGKNGPEKSTVTGTGKNCSRYQNIPGNFRSLYMNIVMILILMTIMMIRLMLSGLGKKSKQKDYVLGM